MVPTRGPFPVAQPVAPLALVQRARPVYPQPQQAAIVSSPTSARSSQTGAVHSPALMTRSPASASRTPLAPPPGVMFSSPSHMQPWGRATAPASAAPRCPLGHPLRPEPSPSRACDVCCAIGTSHSCHSGCRYDICTMCHCRLLGESFRSAPLLPRTPRVPQWTPTSPPRSTPHGARVVPTYSPTSGMNQSPNRSEGRPSGGGGASMTVAAAATPRCPTPDSARPMRVLVTAPWPVASMRPAAPSVLLTGPAVHVEGRSFVSCPGWRSAGVLQSAQPTPPLVPEPLAQPRPAMASEPAASIELEAKVDSVTRLGALPRFEPPAFSSPLPIPESPEPTPALPSALTLATQSPFAHWPPLEDEPDDTSIPYLNPSPQGTRRFEPSYHQRHGADASGAWRLPQASPGLTCTYSSGSSSRPSRSSSADSYGRFRAQSSGISDRQTGAVGARTAALPNSASVGDCFSPPPMLIISPTVPSQCYNQLMVRYHWRFI